MTKILVFLLFLLPMTFGFSPVREVATCACPAVTNLQKTGQGSGSISFSWSSGYDATQYKLWYVRAADGYTSSPVYLDNASHAYSNLAAGRHAFYFVTVCSGEESGFIGTEEIISM